MKCPIVQRCIAILCLVAFGLGQTVFASMGVRCTDASGTSRIEYACDRSADGQCAASKVDSSALSDEDCRGLSPAAPCKDEPLGSKASAATLTSPVISLELVFVAAVVLNLWDSVPPASDDSGRVLYGDLQGERPPDALSRLRTIILLV